MMADLCPHGLFFGTETAVCPICIDTAVVRLRAQVAAADKHLAEAVGAEREGAAKVCEELGDDQYRKLASKGSNDGIARMVQKHYTESAAAIRSRRP